MRTVAFRISKDAPFGSAAQLRRLQLLHDPLSMRKVPAADGVLCGFAGEERGVAQVKPGPFAVWNPAQVFPLRK